MIDWKKIKGDLSKGIKEGAETVAKKAEELSDEGQRKLKIHRLKKDIQEHYEELGAEMYNAEKTKPGTISHEGSMKIFSQIETLSNDLKKMEKKDK